MSPSLFLLILCLTIGAQSTAVKEYQDEVEGHEGECKGKDQKYYKLGEEIKDEPCVRKVCKGTAAPGSVYYEVERCSSLGKGEQCNLKSDTKMNYPDCCKECKKGTKV